MHGLSSNVNQILFYFIFLSAVWLWFKIRWRISLSLFGLTWSSLFGMDVIYNGGGLARAGFPGPSGVPLCIGTGMLIHDIWLDGWVINSSNAILCSGKDEWKHHSAVIPSCTLITVRRPSIITREVPQQRFQPDTLLTLKALNLPKTPRPSGSVSGNMSYSYEPLHTSPRAKHTPRYQGWFIFKSRLSGMFASEL